MRRAAKKDDNHNQIAAAFRSLGCGWYDTFQVGGGFGDGIAEVNTRNIIVEIKDGSKQPSARKLTVPEEKFHTNWRGDLVIIESVEDVVRLVNKIRRG